jgi:hypothetical protein
MHYLRGCLCALALTMGVLMMLPMEATMVGSDTSQDELSWRRGHHSQYYYGGYRGEYRRYGRYPAQRYYRSRPYHHRTYYNRPMYYPAPAYYDPYYPRSGVYLYFRT